MDSLPKLIPLWHNIALQDIVRCKKKGKYSLEKHPDYGGIGANVTTIQDELKCEILKYPVDEVCFGASSCALPFLPVNKVKVLSDPCLEPVKSEKNRFARFCATLEQIRRSVNTRGRENHKMEIVSAYRKLKKDNLKGKYKKLPIAENIVQLAVDYPQQFKFPEFNFSYMGGCLTSANFKDKCFLLHSSGKKMDKLSVTPIQESVEPGKNFMPVHSEEIAIKFDGGKILQIELALEGFCYIRQKNHFNYVNIENPSASPKECIKDEAIHISPSPYNPKEFLLITNKEELKLCNIETKKALWTCNSTSKLNTYMDSFSYQCSFGPHPRSVLLLEEKQCYSYDMRIKKTVKTELFSTSYESCYVKEEFTTMKRLDVNPFQHLIASTYHLFICDERYPKKPVMIWSHMLKGHPLYCDVATYASADNFSNLVILLGTQESRELTTFFAKSSETEVHPVSLSLPLYLSSARDCVDSLRLHCISVDDSIVERFSYPLIGVCIIPLLQRSAFTTFQLTSIGDLFYQDFNQILCSDVERTYRVDTGCVLTPPEKILPHMKSWLNTVCGAEEREQDCSNHWSLINVDLEDILSLPNEISANCVFCRCNKSSHNRELVFTEPCPTCGLESIESQKLSETFSNLALLSGSATHVSYLPNCDANALLQFDDPYSKKILEPWIELDNCDLQAPLSDFNPEFSMTTASPSSVSNSTSLAPILNLSSSLSTSTSATRLTEQEQNLSYLNTSYPDSLPNSQDYSEEFILPSQEVRDLLGETLRTPGKTKIQHTKKLSAAGF